MVGELQWGGRRNQGTETRELSQGVQELRSFFEASAQETMIEEES